MNKVIFIKKLDTNMYRAQIKKKLIEKSNTKDKESSTGPLDSENKWKECESKLINYFSTLIGVNGVSLYCMVWGKDNLDANVDSLNFIYKTISCEPLKVNYFEDNSHTVHQALVSFTT